MLVVKGLWVSKVPLITDSVVVGMVVILASGGGTLVHSTGGRLHIDYVHLGRKSYLLDILTLIQCSPY